VKKIKLPSPAVEQYIIASPDLKKFLVRGTHNSSYDGDYLSESLHDATHFKEAEDARYVFLTSKGKRLPAADFFDEEDPQESRKFGKFIQTCVVVRVHVSLQEVVES
jgi:hypothetical protein